MHHIKFNICTVDDSDHPNTGITRLADTFHVVLRASILDVAQFLIPLNSDETVIGLQNKPAQIITA